MKTAVEWLVEQIQQKLYIKDSVIDQAKEMEKEQIIDAVNFGDTRGKITTYSTAGQYYNETFRSE